MAMTDPIADMLTRIRNALRASHERADIPSSRIKIHIAKVLKTEGYIKNFKIVSDGRHRHIRVFLKYDEDGSPAIEGLKRVSRPSQRVYRGCEEIEAIQNGFGISIISTSRGVMTDAEARKARVGGEILCSVW